MTANNEKLTICFHPWMVYSKNDDFDSEIKEITERGFNCIRIDDGAGLLWDKDGNVRSDVLITAPFGEYTKYTTWRIFVDKQRMNILDRLLRICRAAKKYNVKVVLSSWFYLHVNWFCEESDANRLFDLSTEEKLSYFADELSKILDVLKKENLIDVVAFTEIFNEFDGIPFDGENSINAEKSKLRNLRLLHEKELDKLKSKHPEILFAFDTVTPTVNPEIIPRNIDVLNFHYYYFWSLYDVFERDIVQWSLEEPEIPEDILYYLKEDRVSVADILKEMNIMRTGQDWPRRISLYASIDENKEDELTELLDNELKNKFDYYMNNLFSKIDIVMDTHDKVVPNSKLVMGEGATCCISPTLKFEQDSEYFWKMIRTQMSHLNKKGLWGSVIATSHAPGRLIAWDTCKDLYIEANKLFLGECEV